MEVVGNYDDTETIIRTDMEDLERSKVNRDGEGKGGEKGLSGMSDPRRNVKNGDNFLLNFIKNKRWVDREAEEEAADDNTQGSRATHINVRYMRSLSGGGGTQMKKKTERKIITHHFGMRRRWRKG